MYAKFKTAAFAMGIALALLSVSSCTNLEEETFNVIPADQFGQTQAQKDALIGPLYGGLGDYFDRFNGLNTVTDEQVVPTRGGDWKDGDAWRRLHEHTWSATADNGQFNGLWTWIYNNITRINRAIDGNKDNAVIVAELRALRAFYHYLALDNFGNVIIASGSVEAGTAADQKTRAQVYAFVEKELLDVYPKISKTVGGGSYGRINKYVVDMVLAKLYLNAQVYTGTPQWAKTVQYCDSIISSNKFSLPDDFLSNFSTTNQLSPESILSTPFDKSKRGGMNMQMRTLHYKSQLTYNLPNAPWNGYCTLAEFYDSFDTQDKRKKMWLIGQQFAADGTPLKDDDVPMIIKKEIPAFEMPAGPAGRLAGARSVKYEIQKSNAGVDQDNDFVIYRLGDAYLMRGEANFRLNRTSQALADVNKIRERAGVPSFTSLTLNDILAERGRELAWEYHRRQDLIRFDQFTKAWTFKGVSAKTRELYPIPADQLALNPKLKQNPGY